MPIYYIEEKKRFVLEGRTMAYCFDVSEGGWLYSVYWGARLAGRKDYEAIGRLVIPHSSFESPRGVMGYEYIPWGELVYSQPTLKLIRENGDRGLKLRYKSYMLSKARSGENLHITLSDDRGVEVTLGFTLFADHDIIGRRQTVRNTGSAAMSLENAYSFTAALPWGSEYKYTYFSGKWAGEFEKNRESVRPGRSSIESRRGTTSHAANPFVAIDRAASEDSGEIWYSYLAWSGSFELLVERDSFGFVQLTGGVQSFDFAKLLKPGESFVTPWAYMGYTNGGFGAMSRKAHRFQRDIVLPESRRALPGRVLYNSWEATYFDITEEGQKKLADKAASLGAELFVVDDGWFGRRDSDRAGLGDWTVNEEKFPSGLGAFIQYVHSRDMDFGLWVEPEMVNPDSDLYRAHPDWIYRFDGITPATSRNQYVLNLGLKEVQDYIRGFMDRLLTQYDIQFIKWDMNRAFSDPDSPYTESGREKEIWHRHVEALYEIIDWLRARHPQVMLEACAGGGGRIDLGILSRTDQFWPSDNTDALDRLLIEEGCSLAYLPKAMSCWVTDSPNWLSRRAIPLSFRFHAAMLGTLGIGADLNKWSEEELAEARGCISLYKELRHIVQEGTQYRLITSEDSDTHAAFQYVSSDGSESVVFIFQKARVYGNRYVKVRLKGLKPESRYMLRDRELTASGSFFMDCGLVETLEGNIDSRVLRLVEI